MSIIRYNKKFQVWQSHNFNPTKKELYNKKYKTKIERILGMTLKEIKKANLNALEKNK
tara:strand:- start:1780 stop:1953 length:174 start_codon:yes stop_codon:yes gene_type:complete